MTHEEDGYNDPAFPAVIPPGPNIEYVHGLTKREYFAGLALQGLCGNPYIIGTEDTRAEIAVKYADALLEKLNE